MFKSVNPYDQSLIAEFPEDDEQTLNTNTAAAKTFRSWKKESFFPRASLMKRAGAMLHKIKIQYARMISTAMGKILSEAEDVIEKCAIECDYFADHAEIFLRDQQIITDASKSFVGVSCSQPVTIRQISW